MFSVICKTLVGGVLSLCSGAVGVFYRPSQLGQRKDRERESGEREGELEHMSCDNTKKERKKENAEEKIYKMNIQNNFIILLRNYNRNNNKMLKSINFLSATS